MSEREDGKGLTWEFLNDLRARADNLEWAGGSEDWTYEPDADPDSAYAEFVARLSPAVVIALIDASSTPTGGE